MVCGMCMYVCECIYACADMSMKKSIDMYFYRHVY